MTIALSIFDLFAYAIPGSLYLSAFAYVASRAGWINAPGLLNSPSILLLVALIVAGYLVGQATYGLGSMVDRISPFHSVDLSKDARAEFLKRRGIAANRPYLQVDTFALLAAAEMNNKEAATEISRLRAIGLMLRNAVPPLLVTAIIAFVEIFTSSSRIFAGTTGVLLLLVAAGCIRHASILRRWANLKTLELCYWIKDLDVDVQGWNVSGTSDEPERDPQVQRTDGG